jgi:6-phosphogluconolactonase
MERRTFIKKTGFGASGILLSSGAGIANRVLKSNNRLVFVGTYTESPEQGILRYQFDPSNGKLVSCGPPIPSANPSFLARSHDGNFLFAVNETSDYEGIPGGYVSGYRILNTSGDLEFLGSQATLGAHPCHVSVSADNRFIVISNYTGGNVTVIPVGKNGSLGKAVSAIAHHGSGPNTERQEKAHVHSATFSPDNRFVYVCDLGLDQVVVYPFDRVTGVLNDSGKFIYHTAPGAGPRHFCISREGNLAFLINELNSTLSLLSVEKESGILREISTQSTLPNDFTGQNTCADIHIHPSGKFIYGSNRGHDTIALFKLNQANRTLKPEGHFSTGGKTPRNFCLDPSGQFLLAANQNTGNITVFRIDLTSGHLDRIQSIEGVHKPVCINF